MPVHTGMQTQADGPAYGLGHLALVDGPEPRISRVLDAARWQPELGDDCDIL